MIKRLIFQTFLFVALVCHVTSTHAAQKTIEYLSDSIGPFSDIRDGSNGLPNVSLDISGDLTFVLDAGSASDSPSYTALDDLDLTGGSAFSFTIFAYVGSYGYRLYSLGGEEFSFDGIAIFSFDSYSNPPGGTNNLVVTGFRDNVQQVSTIININNKISGLNATQTFSLSRGSDFNGAEWQNVDAVTVAFVDHRFGVRSVTVDDPVAGDTSAPNLEPASSVPGDNSTNIANSANIVLDFDENINLASGSIVVRNVTDNSTIETFDVVTETDGTTTSPSSGSVSITNDKLYINPTSDLPGNRNISVQIASTAVTDAASNAFAGISDDTTYNFTTANTAPTSSDDNFTIIEDASYTFSLSDFAFSDVDGDSLTSIRINTLPADGTLTLDGTAISANQEIAIANISNNELVYTPAQDGNGTNYTSFTFSVGDGTAFSSDATMTVNVTAQNDAPSFTKTGDLAFVEAIFDGQTLNGVTLDNLQGVSMLALSSDEKQLYAISSGDDKALVVFDRNLDTGALSFNTVFLDGQSGISGMSSPQDIAVSQDGKHIYVTSSSDNALVVFNRDQNTGALTYSATLENGVDGVSHFLNPQLIALSRDETQVFVTAPLSNSLVVFNRNTNTGSLTYDTSFRQGVDGVTGLFGPTDVAVSNDDSQVFVTSVSDDSLVVFDRDSNTGTLSFNTAFEDGVDGVDGLGAAVSVAVTSDGTQVLVLGSGEDSLAIFNRDSTTGTLTYNAVIKDGDSGVEGLGAPALIAISEDGTTVYAASTSDNALTIFERDTATGAINFKTTFIDGEAGVDGLFITFGIAVSNDNASVYAAGIADNAIARFSKPNIAASNFTFDISEDASTTPLLNDYSVGDVDSASITLTLTLSDTSAGTLSAVASGSATVTNVGGVLTISGTPDDVNATLASISFTPAANYNGNTASITIALTDGLASIPTVTTTLNVTAVNDLPTTSDKTVSTNEDAAYTFTLSDFEFSDVDGDSVVSIRIDSLPTNGSLTLDGSAVNAAQTIAIANITNGELVYMPGLNANGNAYTSFTFSVNDGTDFSASPATLTVDVTAQNDAPSFTTTGELAFVEAIFDGQTLNGVPVNGLEEPSGLALSPDGKQLFVASKTDDSLVVFDRNLSTGSLTFNTAFFDGQGGVDGLDEARELAVSQDGKQVFVISQRDSALVVFDRNTDTGVLTYQTTFSPSVSGVNDLASPISISMSADDRQIYVTAYNSDALVVFDRDPSTGNVALGSVLKDGVNGVSGLGRPAGLAASSDGKQVFVLGNAQDSLAIFDRDVNSGDLTFNTALYQGVNGVSGLLSAPNLIVSPDNKQVFVVTLFEESLATFERNPETGELSFASILKDDEGGVDGLNFATNLTSSANGEQIFVTSSGDKSLALFERDVETGALTFSTVFKDGENGVDGLNGANDVVADSTGNTVYVISSSDDAIAIFAKPQIEATNFTFSINEDASATNIFAGYNVNDVDSASITLTLTLSDTSAGTLSAVASGSATVTNVGGVLTISGTPDDVNATLASISFTPAADYNGNTASITIALTDGLASIPAVTTTLNVTPVADLPTSTDSTVSLDEDTAYTFAEDDFNFADVDGDNLVSVLINTLPDNGNLLLNGALISAGATVDASVIAAGGLVFTPEPNANGNEYASFSFNVSDGSLSLNPSTMTINVVAVDDAPSLLAPFPRVALLEESENDANGNEVDGLTTVESIAISPDGQFLYTVGEEVQKVSIFKRDLFTGQVTFVSVFDWDGMSSLADALSIAISPDGRHVYVGGDEVNAGGDESGSFDDYMFVLERNSTTGELSFIQNMGLSSHELESVDGITISADGSFVYVSDQTVDAVVVFERDSSSGLLTKRSSVVDEQDAQVVLRNPRKLTISPDGLHAYVAVGSSDAITLFDRDTITGALSYVAHYENNTVGITGLDSPRWVSISADGNFVYVAASNDDAVVVFSRDSADGTLSHIQTITQPLDNIVGLDSPRYIALSPDNSLVYVAASSGSALVVFNRNASTGMLTLRRDIQLDKLDGARSLAQSDDGNWLFVAAKNSSAINIFKTPNGEAVDFTLAMEEDAPAQSIFDDFSIVEPEGDNVTLTLSLSDASIGAFNGEASGSTILSNNGNTLSISGTAADVTASLSSLSFTPSLHVNGSDEHISIRLTDGNNAMEPLSVALDIREVNDSPTSSDLAVSALEDQIYVFSISDFGFTDVETDTFSIVRIESLPNTGLLTIGTEAVAINAEIASSTIAAGNLTYAPPPDANGEGFASFTIRVSDGSAFAEQSSTISLNVANVNDAPEFSSTALTDVPEDALYQYTAIVSDADTDDILTFSASELPSWLSINQTSGVLTGTPTNDDVGEHSVTLVVSDVEGLSDSQSFQIRVSNTNDAPIITSNAVTRVLENTAYQYQVTAFDVDVGDSITLAANTLPIWLSMDVATGLLAGTPSNEHVGSHSVVITAADSSGAVGTQSFNIEVTNINDAPVISGEPASEVDEFGSYKFIPSASDPDLGDTLTFSIENMPAWAAFNSATGELSGSPDNTFVNTTTSNILISVTDGIETTSLPAFSITVVRNNVAPIGESLNLSLNEDESLMITPVVSDGNRDILSLNIIESQQNGTLNAAGLGWHYQPPADFNGFDRFTYQVTDGELNSPIYEVSIEVFPSNDDPIAIDDVVSYQINADNRYEIDVLANDSDIDGDALSIGSVKASVGQATVEGETEEAIVVYRAPESGFSGQIEVEYTISDGKGGRDSAIVSIDLSLADESELPVLVPPADITVNATGLFTLVDLGVAEAFDSNGNALAVSLLDNSSNLLAPGQHKVFWQTTDYNGNKVVASQTVRVNPLVSLSKDEITTENSVHSFSVFLNGEAPEYPVDVEYLVSGSAVSGIDHDLESGTVTIEDGRAATIAFEIFEDNEFEGEETIVIELEDGLNRGPQNIQTIRVSENNVAPTISLSVTQDSQLRTVVSQNEGLVTVTALISDENRDDELTLNWLSDLTNLSGDPATSFTFDPSLLEAGLYSVKGLISDNADVPLTRSAEVFINVIAALPALGESDSDGDGISDAEEGFGDSDIDGIPDFLDAISDCNVVQEQLADTQRFLVEASPGTCLSKGRFSSLNINLGLQLLGSTIESEVPADQSTINVGGIYDFIIRNIPEPGQSVSVVIPQRRAIPQDAIYRKYLDGEWRNFVQDANNSISSAPGELGVCPPPDSRNWRSELNEGDFCVQLTIEDGGPNDADGEVDGSIFDPGGVAISANGNSLPIATNDAATTNWQQVIVLDVVANDTDSDEDVLQLQSVSVDQGEAEITSDTELRFTPPGGQSGRFVVKYSINDGNQGTASGEAIITVLANRLPLAQNDLAQSKGNIIVIDVLANDTDPDGNSLTVLEASADNGTVELIEGGKQLRYSPLRGFDGVDTIRYKVSDQFGATDEATVRVTVDAIERISVENKSSGSMNFYFLLMLLLMVVMRVQSRFIGFNKSRPIEIFERK